MNTITTTLTTQAVFSDDNLKRYLLRKIWDDKLPQMTVIMLAPSDAAGIALDTTTQLVLNNATRLGFGGVSIVNLFATLNDFSLKQAEEEDVENLQVIVEAAQNADRIVYAPGVGKAKSKVFQTRQEQVLKALLSYESKLQCICNGNGKARLQHPLSPAVREWSLSLLTINELLPNASATEPKQEKPKKHRPKVSPKEKTDK